MIKNKNNLTKKEIIKKSLHYNNLIPIMMIIAIILATTMAMDSPFNTHPDEKERFFCARYYENNWLPPEIGNLKTLKSYSAQGNSRLNELRIDFFLYGKFSKISSLIIKDELLRFRLFGISLFIILTIICIKNPKTRILFLPLIVTPQVWYIFSYINDDVFPLFLSFIIIHQIIKKDSLFNNFLNSQKISDSIIGGILFGVLLGILAISKLNYVLFLIFIIIILFIFFKEKHNQNKKELIKKAFFIIAIAILIFSFVHLIHININGLDRGEKILDYKEKITTYEFKPSTIKDDPKNSAWFTGIKNKGVSYSDMWFKDDWINSNWKTFVGGYGYTNIFAHPGYYLFMKILYLTFFIFTIIILSNSKNQEKYLMALIGGFFILLLFASSIYSWTISLQPQGRYLFPILSGIGLLLYQTKEKFNKNITLILLLLLFLMSAYSFIFIALKNLIII